MKNKNKIYIYLIAVILCFLDAFSVRAQTVYGFRIGANVSTFGGDFADAGAPESRTGLIAGSFTRFALRNEFGVQFEVLYSQKGARFEEPDTSAVEVTLEAIYLEIPVLLTYTVPLSPAVSPILYAGPAVGFEISERIRQRVGEFEQSESSDDLTSPDLGLLLGADVTLPLGGLDALLGVRYTYGFTDLANPERIADPEVRLSNRVLAVTLGFLF